MRTLAKPLSTTPLSLYAISECLLSLPSTHSFALLISTASVFGETCLLTWLSVYRGKGSRCAWWVKFRIFHTTSDCYNNYETYLIIHGLLAIAKADSQLYYSSPCRRPVFQPDRSEPMDVSELRQLLRLAGPRLSWWDIAAKAILIFPFLFAVLLLRRVQNALTEAQTLIESFNSLGHV